MTQVIYTPINQHNEATQRIEFSSNHELKTSKLVAYLKFGLSN